jgi:uncharacterized oxidoreductase
MKLKQKTILITGGSSGIGLELTRQLSQMGNKVLICARSRNALESVTQQIRGVCFFVCDLSLAEDRRKLVAWVIEHHSECSALINNAALVHKTDFRTDENAIEKATLEIQTNLVAPIELSNLLLPMLERNKGAIINITTGLIYAPRAVYPFYNATKAGLHAFTQVLRFQLKQVPLKVIEVMMPVVNTPWHKGDVPKIAIAADRAVKQMLVGIGKGETEVLVGKVWLLKLLSRLSPGFAFRKINSL